MCASGRLSCTQVKWSKQAEDAGFGGVMVSDHFHPWVPSQGQSAFVWALMGAIGQATQKVGYSAYQTIIVASLVEAEAKDDADRPKIARVIYNRLAKHIPLGIDAAFYYTLPLDRRGTALPRG